MAERVFSIRTEPHVARIGDRSLYFEPEVVGTDFMRAYQSLQAAQERASVPSAKRKPGKAGEGEVIVSELALEALHAATYEFLSAFLVPESRDLLKTLRLPQRVVIELIEWVAELYGGGSGNPDAASGPSSG